MTGPIYEVLAPHHVAVEGDPYTMVCLVGGFIARSAVSRDNRVWNDLPLDPEAILRRVRSEELPALEQQTGEPRLTTSGLVVRFSRSLPKLLDY